MISIPESQVKMLRHVGGPSGARAIAQRDGTCTIIRSTNASVCLYYRDGGKVRQKTWKFGEYKLK